MKKQIKTTVRFVTSSLVFSGILAVPMAFADLPFPPDHPVINANSQDQTDGDNSSGSVDAKKDGSDSSDSKDADKEAAKAKRKMKRDVNKLNRLSRQEKRKKDALDKKQKQIDETEAKYDQDSKNYNSALDKKAQQENRKNQNQNQNQGSTSTADGGKVTKTGSGQGGGDETIPTDGQTQPTGQVDPGSKPQTQQTGDPTVPNEPNGKGQKVANDNQGDQTDGSDVKPKKDGFFKRVGKGIKKIVTGDPDKKKARQDARLDRKTERADERDKRQEERDQRRADRKQKRQEEKDAKNNKQDVVNAQNKSDKGNSNDEHITPGDGTGTGGLPGLGSNKSNGSSSSGSSGRKIADKNSTNEQTVDPGTTGPKGFQTGTGSGKVTGTGDGTVTGTGNGTGTQVGKQDGTVDDGSQVQNKQKTQQGDGGDVIVKDDSQNGSQNSSGQQSVTVKDLPTSLSNNNKVSVKYIVKDQNGNVITDLTPDETACLAQAEKNVEDAMDKKVYHGAWKRSVDRNGEVTVADYFHQSGTKEVEIRFTREPSYTDTSLFPKNRYKVTDDDVRLTTNRNGSGGKFYYDVRAWQVRRSGEDKVKRVKYINHCSAADAGQIKDAVFSAAVSRNLKIMGSTKTIEYTPVGQENLPAANDNQNGKPDDGAGDGTVTGDGTGSGNGTAKGAK